MTGKVIFASAGRCAAIGAALAEETSKPVGYLNSSTGPLALRKVIVGMGSGELDVVLATEDWSYGWRAPMGWVIEFDDSFTDDLLIRAQAKGRVLSHLPGGRQQISDPNS